MGLKQPELGDRQRFEARRGVGGFSMWGGVNRETDPSCVDPWEFHHLVNVSYDSESLTSRGGQEKLGADTAMSACVSGIIDLGGAGPGASMLVANNDLPDSGVGGVYVINDQNSPAQQRISLFDSDGPGSGSVLGLERWTQRRCLFRFRNEIYVYCVPSPPPTFLMRLDVKSVNGTVVAAATRALDLAHEAHSAVEFQDKLWFGDSDTTGGVSYWDGTSLVRDVAGLGASGVMVFPYNEELYAFGLDFCKKRGPDGAWSSVSLPGGIDPFFPQDWAVYNNTLYVSGQTRISGSFAYSTILSSTGGSFALARSLAGTGNANDDELWGAAALCVFDGKLYYGYHVRIDANRARLGSYDGSTWTDDVFDFYDGAGLTQANTVGSMVEHRGNLRVGLFYPGAPVTQRGVAKSNGTNTASWTYEAAASVRAMDMLVF